MNRSQTSCPACGESVSSDGICPHCGAALGESPERVIAPGDCEVFECAGRDLGVEAECVEVAVRIAAEWADLVSRTVYTAKILSCTDSGEEGDEPSLERLRRAEILVEVVNKQMPRGLDELPSESSLPLRKPVAEKRVEGRRILLFRNDAGVSLAEIVALAGGSLDVRQVASLFTPVLEAISDVHDAGMLHLYLNPELLRIRPQGTEKGVPVEAEDRGRRDRGETLGDAETQVETPGGNGTWKRSQSAETRPQKPIGRRISDEETPDFESLAEESSDLDEETSEVSEGEMRGENWLHRVGIPTEQSAPVDDGAESGVSDSRTDRARRAAEALGADVEAVVGTVSGLFSRDELPEKTPVIPGFSPPEMYGGDGVALGEASDVFGAGMVLYYLIAGRRPPASVYTRHRPAVPARNFRPAFAPGLGAVVKRATRSDPEMRYPDIRSMRAAFDDALEAIEDRTPRHRESLPETEAAVDRHVGISKRDRNPVNQDRVFEESSEDGGLGMVVVADGVSTASYGSGEVASELLVEVARERWNELLSSYLMDESFDDVEVVGGILDEANERIVEYVNESHSPFEGSAHEVMGTTALVAIYREGTATLGAVGDSRAYLQRGPGLEQLTIDHNLWTLSILEGLGADEALSMSRGDALARCLGTFAVEDGRLESVSPGYDLFQFSVAEGDKLLMATDGLVDFAGADIVSAEENIQANLLSEADPALACLELIVLANRGGGGDNIGVGVVNFE